MGFTGGTSGKEPTCQGRRCRKWGIDPWVGKIPCRRAWQPTPLFLPRESHGQRSLVGYGPYGCKESYTLSDWTEAPCTVVYKVKVQTTTVSKKLHILIKKCFLLKNANCHLKMQCNIMRSACIYVEVELLDHMVSLCLIIQEITRMSSKAAAPFCFPINSAWGNGVYSFLTTFVIVRLFWF